MWRERPGMKFSSNAHVQRLPPHSPATSTWEYPQLRANTLVVKQRNSKKAEPLESVGVFGFSIGVIIHVCSSVDPIMGK